VVTTTVFDRRTRRNVVALGLDFGLFLVGLSFASQSTVLVAFAADLGARNVVIGAIPAIMTVGWFFPSLFAAAHTETLAYKLPFLLRYTAWERIPFLLLALVAFFVAGPLPTVALALLLMLLLVMTGTGGVLMPAWMDLVGRCVPAAVRGRFFALSSLLGSVGGLMGGAFTAYVLAVVPAPRGYAVCFLGASLFMGLSWIALMTVRESEPLAPAAPVALTTYLRRIPALLRRDRNLAWFVVGRACAAAGTMATGFYTVYALRVLGAPAWEVGVFTTLSLIGQVVGLAILGGLADRAGHRATIIAGAAAITLANVVALLAPSLPAFFVVFVLAGVNQAAINVSGWNILLDFAPSLGEQPTYVGLGNTALGPVVFLAPLLAGALADTLGFSWTFLVAAGFGAMGTTLLTARVRDPRHASRSAKLDVV